MSNWKKEYYQIAATCESRFAELGQCWHLCTDGKKTDILFPDDNAYVFGMNLMGLCADRCKDKVRIYTFILMSNHIHIIIGGSSNDCLNFFELYRTRLKKYLAPKKNGIRFKGFDTPKMIPITDVKMLRFEIAYVNRNAFVDDFHQLPFSSPWSAGSYFFNTFLLRLVQQKKYNSLRNYQKYEMLYSRDVALSDQIQVTELHFIDNQCIDLVSNRKISYDAENITIKRMILPDSYCYISDAESLFVDHHQYFYIIDKDSERYSESAKRLGDDKFLNDTEICNKAFELTKKLFGFNTIGSLDKQQKIEIARILKKEYGAGNSQIERSVRLESEIVNELFPQPKR